MSYGMKAYADAVVENLKSAVSVSVGERKVALCIFLIGVLAYFVFISHALLNNHSARLPYMLPNDQLWAGRWFNLILARLNYGADIPVFMPLQSVAMATISAMIALRLWDIDRSFWTSAIVGGWIVAFPFALAFFYFSYQTPLFFVGWLFSAIAAWSLSKPSAAGLVAASILIMLVSASYQAALSVFAVLVATSALADLSRRNAAGFSVTLIEVLKKVAFALAALGIGLLLYWLSLKLLDLNPPGETTVVSLTELPNRLIEVASAVVQHLTTTQPELLDFQKSALLLLLGTSIFVHVAMIAAKGGYIRAGVAFAFWFGALLATKTIFLIVNPAGSIFDYRYNTSFAFLHAFTALIVISSIPRSVPALKVGIVVATAFLLMQFVQADLVRQLVLLRGQQHDMALSNRILARIEALPELERGRVYDFVRIGRYPDYRQGLLASRGRGADWIGDSHMDTGQISAQWVDEDVLRILGASVRFRHALTDVEFRRKENEARELVLAGREPWPHASSVFIVDDTIYVYMR